MKRFITEVIKCSYCERTFGMDKSERIVKLVDVIRLLNLYGIDKDFHITDEEVEKILNNYFAELKGEDKLTCDRNICLNNEYNNIGCEDCVVTKGE